MQRKSLTQSHRVVREPQKKPKRESVASEKHDSGDAKSQVHFQFWPASQMIINNKTECQRRRLYFILSVAILCTILTRATSSGSHADVWLSIVSLLSRLFAEDFAGIWWSLRGQSGSGFSLSSTLLTKAWRWCRGSASHLACPHRQLWLQAPSFSWFQPPWSWRLAPHWWRSWR